MISPSATTTTTTTLICPPISHTKSPSSTINRCQKDTHQHHYQDQLKHHNDQHHLHQQHEKPQPKSMLICPNSTTKSTNERPLPASCNSWNIKASQGSLNTSNPIREIIESINLSQNPNKKVIPLSIGDPTIFGNLTPCKEILDSLRKAETSGKYYGYQTAAGLEEARQAVANYHYKNAGNKLEAKDVILTSGCSHAIDLCICVLAQAGQNILIPRPGFPLYKTLASVYGVNYKQYDLLADSNWSIDLNHLESLIDDQTAAIVINNPSNPCGSVFSKEHLLDILALAERYKKPIIADEIYDKFVFLPEHYKMHGIMQPATTTNTTNNIDNKQLTDNLKTTKQSSIITSTTTTTINNRKQSMRSSNKLASSTTGDSVQRPKSDGFWSSEDDEVEEEDEDEGEEEMDEMDADVDDERSYNLIRKCWRDANNGCNLSDSNDVVCTNDIIEYDDGVSEPETMSDLTEESSFSNNSGSTSGQRTPQEQLATISESPFIALSSLSKNVPILTCGGISKTCRIPGLRLGWIIVNDPIGAFNQSVRIGLNRLTQRLMGPNSLVQGALREILEKVPESFYTNTMEFIFRNALLCYKRLAQMPGLEPYMPQGSMYLMVRFEPSAFPSIEGDLDFTSKLMNEESVLVLPGKCFEFPNFFRICLTVPTNVMDDALDRMAAFCERHHKPMQDRYTSTNRNSDIKVFR